MAERQRTIVANVTNHAANTDYYPSSSGMPVETAANIAMQLTSSSGVTITFEASNEASGTDNFVDITESVYSRNTGVDSASSFVDKNDILELRNLMVARVRVKAVFADTSNALKLVSIQDRVSTYDINDGQ